MIDLNSKQYESAVVKIFNNGEAGKVDNVTISVARKSAEDGERHPDFKLIVTDSDDQSVNQGFYYPSKDPAKTEEQNNDRIKREISRVLHVAHAVVGKDYEFPKIETPKEAFDVLFKVIEENAGDKKFNVFVNYGSKGYPSKYLGLRYFNFIEPADQKGATRLKPTPQDQLERIDPDAPSTSGSSEGTEESWLDE